MLHFHLMIHINHKALRLPNGFLKGETGNKTTISWVLGQGLHSLLQMAYGTFALYLQSLAQDEHSSKQPWAIVLNIDQAHMNHLSINTL